MAEAQEKIEAWRLDYNDSRPQQALKELTPSEFAQKCRAKKRSADVTYAGNQLWQWTYKPQRFKSAIS
jgi:hypothetical protein